MNLTDQFISAIRAIQYVKLPQRVILHARACVLDYIGCALAGAKTIASKEQDLVLALSAMQGECSLLGHHAKASMQNAALINGISAHMIELDDGHRVGMLHLGAPIISGLLAVAERERLSTEDFLYGVIIGYEVAIRLACAVQPGCKLRGYHATGTCGTVGVAMGIAAALHYDFEQSESAFSAAVTSAAGVLEMIEGDSELKPYNAGRAAMDGLTAAMIGRARFKAPDDALGGKRGFLRIMTDEAKLQYLTDFTDSQYMIEQIYQKPYAACRHCHAPIEAALIISNEGIDISQIERVHVRTYKLAVAGHEHTKIAGTNSAKMSIPYSVAVALIRGSAGMDDYADKFISNVQILELTKKVHVEEDAELTPLCPQKRVAIVEAVLQDGSHKQVRVDYPKGEPENPITPAELMAKFMDLATWSGVKIDTAERIADTILYGDVLSVFEKL